MLFKALNLITDKKIQNFQKNSKKHLQKVLCYDNINLGHAREIKNTKQ